MAGAKSFTLIGDSLCLDLANTLEWRGTERKTDWLTDYADLLAWAQHAGALEPRLTFWTDGKKDGLSASNS